MPGIHIERLHLDLRGISPAVAQSALASLAPALEQALAARASGAVLPAPSPTLHLPADPTATTLRQALAHHLAATLAAGLPPNR
jgi:hypothetical protein